MTPAPYLKFAAELRRAMTRRRISCGQLARDTGADPTSVARWRTGKLIPIHPTVIRIAEYLPAPALVELSVEWRTGRCEVCGIATLNLGRKPGPARFCGARCANTANDRARRGVKATLHNVVVTRRLAEHQAAVEAMCFSCEPERICRDAGCALRPVSPLPFIPMHQISRRIA